MKMVPTLIRSAQRKLATSLGFALVSFCVLSSLQAEDAPVDAIPRPNVIIILADDLGYGDTSVYDGWIETPHLERMASEGMTFNDFHSNSSVCSPTRAALMTGRYQQRVGIVDVIVGNRDTHGLPTDEVTLPQLMRGAGYKTALYGKWHLGQQSEFNPVRHGFDHFIGYLIGAADYHNHKASWYDGLKRKDQKGYTTHLITDFSVDFINQHQDAPFFLMVSHEAVHLPFQTPEDTLENRKPVPKDQLWNRDRIRPKYKIMMEEMDKGIGKILNTLVETGISENTLVFFFSDNGAIGAGSNRPWRGGKFSHYEGGHRVPAIAWWPGKIAPGTTSDALAAGMDLLPTVLEVTQTPAPNDRQFDGESLRSHLIDGSSFPRRELFFGYEPKLGTAMRDGDWKMIVSSRGTQLFDLAKDPAEQTDISGDHPDRTARMQQAIRRWRSEVEVESPRKSAP